LYKTFTIGGLISYHGDLNELSLSSSEERINEENWLKEPYLFYNKNTASNYAISYKMFS